MRKIIVAFALTTALLVPPSASAKLPRMNPPAAKYYAGKAFKKHSSLLYRYASHKKISDCKRISRPRMRCKARWHGGSASLNIDYRGHVTIWYSRNKRGTLFWNYAYDIKSINRDCQQAGAGNCTQHYHVD